MSYILHIETATKICSVSLGKNGTLIHAKEESSDKYIHAERLNLLVTSLLKEAKIDFSDLVAVAIDKGPGSFTGLRIGVSTAKGLCYGLNIPLISIDSLHSLTHLFLLENSIIKKNELIMPMIDARRKEVYTCAHSSSVELISPIQAIAIDKEHFNSFKPYDKIHVLGDGCMKFKTEYESSKLLFHPSLVCTAKSMIQPAYKAYQKKEFENTAYFEPFYLKDFKVT